MPTRQKFKSLINYYLERYNQLLSKAVPFKKYIAYKNWILANYEMICHKDKVRSKPLKLTIETTNICILNCPLCPTGLRILDRENGHMDLKLFKCLMEEVGDYLFFIDFFNWGEPFIKIRNLIEMISIANKYQIITSVSTNLSLSISDDDIRDLLMSGLSELVFSIDGASQETYSIYRRKGNFQLVCKNMHRIMEMKRQLGLRKPLVTWRYLVFSFNENEIEKAQQMANEIGVDRLQFAAPYLDEGLYPLTMEDKELMRTWGSSYPQYNFHHPQHMEKIKTEKTKIKTPKRCDWHYVSAVVNWDGSIAPCCGLYKKENDAGYMNNDNNFSLMDVFNNDFYQHIRAYRAGKTIHTKSIFCEKCDWMDMFGYGRGLNRSIIYFTIAGFIEKMRLSLKLNHR